MLEDLSIRHDPLVVGDEVIANRWRRNGSSEQTCDERRLPGADRETCRRADVVGSVHSHSIVAGGFELTS